MKISARTRISGLILIVCAMTLLSGIAMTAQAEEFSSKHHRFRVTAVASGLEHPWSLAFLPDGDMLISERPGRLRIVREGVLLQAPVQGLPQIRVRGQGGLLDLLPHPDFANNRLLYFSYSANLNGEVTTHVARGKI